MKIVLRFFILLACWFSIPVPSILHAQLLPPNQPEQDACNALMICGNTFTSPYGYQGTGLVYDLSNTPCAGGEANSMWMRLEITSPGILVFTIAPLTVTDDYDMAVLNITSTGCTGLTSAQVVRCNYNTNLPTFNNGIIGLNTTSTLQFVTSGSPGNSYLQQITANAGDVYLIMINNFGTGFTGPVSGFTIDFAGSTAVFNQPPPPKMQQILPFCDLSQQLTLQVNTPVFCSSIAPDGSDFYITPAGAGTIASVQGINCTGSSGYTTKIKVNFSSPLPNGDYSIHAKVGTDGNTLLGLCNSQLALPDSLHFHVGLDPITMISLDSPACQKVKINLNTPVACNSIAPNGSDFIIVGPSSVIVSGAAGTGCVPGGFTSSVVLTLAQPIAVDGLYKVRSQIGSDGNTLIDSCGRILLPQDEIAFVVNSFNGLLQARPDTTICNIGQTVTLYAVNNGPPPSSGFNYEWTPATNLQDPTAPSTPLVVTDYRNYYVLETVDANGCYLRDSAKIIVKPFSGTLTPVTAEICIDDPLLLHAGGGSIYHWFDNAALTGIPATLDCSNCPEPKALPPLGTTNYYVLIKNNLGCLDTLTTAVLVHDKPIITASPADTTIKYGKDLLLQATGGYFYSWSPTSTLNDSYSPTPLATPQNPTAYVVIGTNEFGCRSTDTCMVNIDYRESTMIPNAFSPNGDGNNDVFKVQNIHFRKLLAFMIFDRWGKKIFETSNPDIGWDGNYKGKPVDAGVFNYYIKLGYADDMEETFKGDLTLIR